MRQKQMMCQWMVEVTRLLRAVVRHGGRCGGAGGSWCYCYPNGPRQDTLAALVSPDSDEAVEATRRRPRAGGTSIPASATLGM